MNWVRNRLGMVHKWFMNQNFNAYYKFLGALIFHECVHRWGKHNPASLIK